MELWTYYKVTIEGAAGAILMRVTGERGGRIFGLEVDDHGRSIRRADGTLQFRVLDRRTLGQITPMTLIAGRLVAADKRRPDERHPKASAEPRESVLPPG